MNVIVSAAARSAALTVAQRSAKRTVFQNFNPCSSRATRQRFIAISALAAAQSDAAASPPEESGKTVKTLPQPSPEQQRLIDVLRDGKNAVVTAGAGSGKTTAILLATKSLGLKVRLPAEKMR